MIFRIQPIWVDVFSVKNPVETLKMLLKLNNCETKEKTILEILLHKKIFGFCQRKQNKPLFSKTFVSTNILCPKKKKNFSKKLLVQKASADPFSYKKMKKPPALI